LVIKALSQIHLQKEWDPTVSSSKLIGRQFYESSSHDIVELTFSDFSWVSFFFSDTGIPLDRFFFFFLFSAERKGN